MPRHARIAPFAFFCALVVLAGCSSASAGLAKVTHSRTTIPAEKTTAKPGGKGESKPVEPAFAVDKLRKVDPCGLFDAAVLAAYGTPQLNKQENYDRCMTTVKDPGGKTIIITVDLGENMLLEIERADKKVAGLRATERTSQNSCGYKMITQEGNFSLGVVADVIIDGGKACEIAEKVSATMVERLRANPQQRAPAPGSLVELDPCTMLAPEVVFVITGDRIDPSPYKMRRCTWSTLGKPQIALNFSFSTDPKDSTSGGKPDEVDVDGLKVYKRFSNSSFPRCELSWQHRNAGKFGDVVELKVEDLSKPPADTCAKAIDVVKAMVPKLPKP